MALFCAACLIGGQNAMASEALITIHGKPMFTPEEVMNRFDYEIKRADNPSLAVQSMSKTDVKEGVSYLVALKANDLVMLEWFKKHKDQERAVLEKTNKDCKNSNTSCKEWLAANKNRMFAEKHFDEKHIPQPQDLSERQQAMMDTYKKELGIKVHEDNINKVVDRIVSKWNIQK